jgi:hypothetical protein
MEGVVALAWVRDPDGRRVAMTEHCFDWIASSHPELQIHEREILRTVTDPDRRTKGPRPGEEWFHLSGLGPTRRLRVVVRYERDTGSIITAFAGPFLP